jgi:hypothetical protein
MTVFLGLAHAFEALAPLGLAIALSPALRWRGLALEGLIALGLAHDFLR